MILIVPIFWPFLVIWAMFRFWRVTLPLAAAGLGVLVYSRSPVWGVVVGIGLVLAALWIVKIAQDARAVADHRSAVLAMDRHRAAVDREYAGMQLQAELNAQAMARVAREQRF